MYSNLCQLLNIKYPIIQGAMAWISDASLVSAVSNAGGLGVLATGHLNGEQCKKEIDRLQTMTKNPFAVNIMLLSEYAEEIVDAVIEKKVPVVTTGAGSPGKYMKRFQEAGIKVLPVVSSVALAKRMEKEGADAVIAEGMESGGHVGKTTTMSLIPQVVDAVRIPVVAAGGIADGRGMAAAFMLGACGVQIGTRFLVAKECTVHENYKKRIVKANDIDTTVTGQSTNHPVRVIRNKLTRRYDALEKANASIEELEAIGKGALKLAVKDGDMENGSVMSGQIAGLVKQEETCADIIQDIYNGYFTLMSHKDEIL